MLVDQGAAGDLGRVGGQHQLDAQLEHGGDHRGGRHPLRQQLAQPGGQAAGGGQHWIGPARYIVVLVGDIGEVEELAEGPGHRHELFVTEVVQHRLQLLAGPPAALPGALGQAPDLFNQVEKGLPFRGGDRLPEQPAEETDITAQRAVNGIAQAGTPARW